jgi:hypothetical protein
MIEHGAAVTALEKLRDSVGARSNDLGALLAEALELATAAEPTRALGHACIAVATALPPDTPAAAVLPLVSQAARAFDADGDSTPSELVIAWHNVAMAANVVADGPVRAHAMTRMVHTAAERPGPLTVQALGLLAGLAELCERSRQLSPMRVLERRMRSGFLGTPGLSDAFLSDWLARHVGRLLRAGPPEPEDEMALAQAVHDLSQRADAAMSLAAACVGLGAFQQAGRRWAEAAASFDRARAGGLGPEAVTEVLSMAGRAWFHAGDFDKASSRCLEALRRRAAGTAAVGPAEQPPP